ncbi:YcxB family protein [Pseudomonas tohonis]|jgi:hypothetical protein|uniref:YcxB family protein n=1 Tax=Pseudomonas tohonis TaxID=2725477 RepID=UPI001F360688|nr:YcxB family protein [Pseudomonas tohonis]
MIEKDFQPSSRLFFRATREILSATWPVRIMTVLALLLPVVAIAMVAFTNARFSAATWGGVLGLSAYTFLVLPLFQFLGVRRNLASNPSANQVQHYEFSESGIRNFGNGVNVNLDWGKVVRIRSSRSFVLFYISRNSAYFVPKELLTPGELRQIFQWYSTSREAI